LVGLPDGATFFKLTLGNAEVTVAGVENNYLKSAVCPKKLFIITKLSKVHQYESIFPKLI
jgi:hypothetical protein